MITQDYWIIVNEHGHMVSTDKGRGTLYTDLSDAERELAVVRRREKKATLLAVRVHEHEHGLTRQG